MSFAQTVDEGVDRLELAELLALMTHVRTRLCRAIEGLPRQFSQQRSVRQDVLAHLAALEEKIAEVRRWTE